MVYHKHKVQYYETDKMGITHHSNYIRWMEEGRTAFFEAIGFPYSDFERIGIFSPVTKINCEYKNPTTYCDEVEIHIAITYYTGVRAILSYEMYNSSNGKCVFCGSSEHCFLKNDGGIVRVNRAFPELHQKLLSLLPNH